MEQRSRSVSRQSSLDRNFPSVCPICVDVEIIADYSRPDGAKPSNFSQNICSECNQTVCKNCGSFELNPKTKVHTIIFYPKLLIHSFPWANLCSKMVRNVDLGCTRRGMLSDENYCGFFRYFSVRKAFIK